MNYEKLYYSIINNAKSENRKKNKLTLFENHHIIPKSIGGNNEKDNLVLLTPKEHYLCHRLLIEIYRKTIYENKMYFAMWCMINGFGNQKRHATSSRIYERLRYDVFNRVKENPKKRKEISQYDMYGNYIETFESVRHAALSCKLNASSIENCARGETKSSGGFNWKYHKSDKIIRPITHKKPGRKNGGTPWNKGKKTNIICSENAKKILQFSLNGEFIKEWRCIFAASIELNISRGAIENCARGKVKSSGGFNWKYYNSSKEILPVLFDKPGRKLGSIPWNKKQRVLMIYITQYGNLISG